MLMNILATPITRQNHILAIHEHRKPYLQLIACRPGHRLRSTSNLQTPAEIIEEADPSKNLHYFPNERPKIKRAKPRRCPRS